MNILTQGFNYFTAVLRLVWLGLHFILGLSLLLIYRIRWGKQWFYTVQGAQATQRWMQQGCRILNLNIHVKGEVAADSTILVANHISWLDIVAIAAVTPVTFVSKLDLKHWPIVGVLAKFSGTVFIKRGSLFSMHETLNNLVNVLNLGRKTIFFPEGTTTTGVGVNKFHSGLFETAYTANCAVQPIAIRYFREGKADRDIAPYVDDDHFLMHLWRLLVERKISLQLDFLKEIPAKKHSRRELAQTCQQRISNVLTSSSILDEAYPIEVKESGYVLIN